MWVTTMAKKESEKLYKAIYDEDTHLASSNDTSGAVRGNLLDNETNKPVGNAEFIEIDPNEIYNQGYNDGINQYNTYDYVDDYYNNDYNNRRELSPEEKEIAELVGTAIAAGIIWIGEEVIAPAVSKWWKEKASPKLNELWNSVTKKNKKQNMNNQSIVYQNSTDVKSMFSNQLETAYNKYASNMTNEEAQKELMDIFILSAILAKKVRRLSHANIVSEDEMLTILTSDKYISSINNILSSNPMLLEQKENELSEILGYNIREKELLYIDRNDLINVFNEE